MSEIPLPTEKQRLPRLVFDVTTAAHWAGLPNGISRVQLGLVRAAAAQRRNAVLAIFDHRAGRYRSLSRHGAALAFHPRTIVDPTIDSGRNALGRWHARRAAIARLRADGAGGDAERIPADWVTDGDVGLGPGDVVVDVGAGWEHGDIDTIAALKRRHGFRYAVLCHDIIPLMFPEWCGERPVANFRSFLHGVSATADLVLFHSRRVAADAKSYLARQGLPEPPSRVVPIGCGTIVRAASVSATLPPGLVPDRFALAVGVIEPRKGYRLLLDVWRDLRAAGVPGRQRFKLVVAGKPGWLVDDLIVELGREHLTTDDFVWLRGVGDALLDRLYRDCAFCLMPSGYEGYGLPVREAYAYGKPVISSSGGALPEVVGAFSPCLDPDDRAGWARLLGAWIADPATRECYAAAIRARYRPMTWEEAAPHWLAVLEGIPPRSEASAAPAPCAGAAAITPGRS